MCSSWAGEGWASLSVHGVFLGYSPCRAYLPGWTSKSEDCPNLLAHCTWPSLKKAARCTCIPLREPFSPAAFSPIAVHIQTQFAFEKGCRKLGVVPLILQGERRFGGCR